METYDTVKDFFDYILDDDQPGYDENLPFGGIREDAPEKAKKAYAAYPKEYRKQQEQGVKV